MNLKINDIEPYGYKKYSGRFFYPSYIEENEMEWPFYDIYENQEKKIKISLDDIDEIERLGGYDEIFWDNYFFKENKINTSKCYYTIYLPLNYFFLDLNYKEVLEILSILKKLELLITFEYYEAGESYGLSEKTIVKKEKTVVKSFNIIFEEKLFTINSFLSHYKNSNDISEIQLIVKEYIENLNEYYDDIAEEEYRDYTDKQKNEKNFSERNDYYNNDLDMDQQSSEFWDNL